MPQRVLSEQFWRSIGDAYSDLLDMEKRRFIEAMWQSHNDIAADASEYINHQKNIKMILTSDVFAPAGNIPVRAEGISINQTKGRVQWGFESGGKWVWVVFFNSSPGGLAQLSSNKGSVVIGQYSFIYTSYTSTELHNGGTLLYLSCENVELARTVLDQMESTYSLGSEIFSSNTSVGSDDSRWQPFLTGGPTPSPSGLDFNVPAGVNWHGVYDNRQFNGASDIFLSSYITIDQFPDSDLKTVLSLDMYGSDETSTRIQVCIESDGRESLLKFNYHGQATIEFFGVNNSASPSEIFQSLLQKEPVELSIAIHSERNEASAYISVGQKTFASKTRFSIKPSNRKINATFFNSTEEDLNVNLKGIIIKSGVQFERGRLVDVESYGGPLIVNEDPERMSLSRLFSPSETVTLVSDFMPYTYSATQHSENSLETIYLYENEGDASFFDVVNIVDAIDGIREYPYKLSPEGYVVSHNLDTNEIIVEIDPGWQNFFPKSLRINVDEYEMILWEKNGYVSEGRFSYEIRTTTAPIDYSIDGNNLVLTPWYLKRSEISFDKEGVFSTLFELPNKDIWFLEARVQEVNLYGRFGQLLEIEREEDSQKYLNIIKGLYIGRRSHSTKNKLERSINMLLGVPFTNRSGNIDNVYRHKDPFGDIVGYSVEVDGFINQMDPYFYEKIRSADDELQRFDSLSKVRAIVDDWVTDPELVLQFADVWEHWGTFIVSVPIYIGMNAKLAEYLRDHVYRVRDVHRKFVILQRIIDENDDSLLEIVEPEVSSLPHANAHTIEDMLFDDHGESSNNWLNAGKPDQPTQLLNDQTYYIGWETQSEELITLNGGMLDEGRALDAFLLVRPDVTYDDPGVVYGVDYALQENDLFNRNLYRADAAIHISRDMEREVYNTQIDKAEGTLVLDSKPIPGTVKITYNLSIYSDQPGGGNTGTFPPYSTSVNYVDGEITFDPSDEFYESNVYIEYKSFESPFTKRRLRMNSSFKLIEGYVESVYGSQDPMWRYTPNPYSQIWFYQFEGNTSDSPTLNGQNLALSENGLFGSMPINSQFSSIASPEPGLDVLSLDTANISGSAATMIFVDDMSAQFYSNGAWTDIGDSTISVASSGDNVIYHDLAWFCAGDEVNAYDLDTASWLTKYQLPGQTLVCVEANKDLSPSSSIWFSGTNGYITQKDDGSTLDPLDTWVDHTADAAFGASSVNDLWRTADLVDVVWAVGDDGKIRKYVGPGTGTPWEVYDVGIGQNLKSVHGYPTESGWDVWVVGDSVSGETVMWYKPDSESQFQRVDFNFAIDLKSICFHMHEDGAATFIPTSYHGHAVGDNGAILVWRGQGWYQQQAPNGYTGNFKKVSILWDEAANTGFGFAGGSYDGTNEGLLLWS